MITPPFRLTCVVPMYNEEAHVSQFVPALATWLQTMTPDHDIILVDDGSHDRTVALATELLPYHRLTILELSRNFGKEYALTAGLDHADGDAVILIDGDFQHPLDLIPEFVSFWRQGYDMVYGIRNRQAEGPVKRYLTRLFYNTLKLGSAIDMPADAGDFRLLDRRVVHALRQLPERGRYMKGLYAWVGFRSKGVPFQEHHRLQGTSRFNWRRLSSLALTGFTAFSDLPLRIWIFIGALVAMLAFAYGMDILITALIEKQQAPGWATLATGMMFFGGIQLLSVGVLGEYIARIFNEVKGRPQYVIARTYRSLTTTTRPDV